MPRTEGAHGYRALDALLLLDKPNGLSSNAAAQRVKRLYRAQKVGHGGTLDPLASGLLPILLGEATKFAGRVLDARKAYTARVALGVTTATGDAEGEVLERRTIEVSAPQIERALAGLRGKIQQVPPMYSALKVGGRPLYQLARAGETIERAPRPVEIFRLELRARGADWLEIDVECSKGTYVRSLAVDLGAALGTGAYLAALRRTGAGTFSVTQAIELEALEAMQSDAARDARLLPLEQLLVGLPRVDLDAAESPRFRNGQVLQKQGAREGLCQVFSSAGDLIGLGNASGGVLRVVRLRAAQATESLSKTQPFR